MRPSNKRSDGGGGGGGGGNSSKHSKSTDETPAPEPPLPTRAQARAKLTAFFGVFPGLLLDVAQEPPEFPLEEALSLLKVHPTLSTESFDDKGSPFGDRHHKRSRIPLSFFIEARADLTTIQQVYQLNPMHRNAFSPSQKFDGVIDACKFGAKDGVIAFLIEKFPRAVEARDRNGNSSLEMVLLHGISISRTENERFEVADLLLKDHRLEDYVTHYKEDSLLRTALFGEYGFRWMCLLFQKCRRLEFFHVPEADDEDDDDEEEVLGDFQISTKEAYGLSLLLPKVKTMICQPTSWTFEGLLHFLHSLGSIAKVEDLSLWIPSLFLYGSGNATITSTLQEMLALNTSLRKITLMGDSQNDDALLRSIAIALSSSNISSVAIVSFSLSQVETLSNFLSACQNTTLHISSLEIQGSWHMAKCWATCKIKALTIDVDGSEWVQGLLSQLDEMPLLERLRLASLHSTNEIDVTTSLVSILAAGKLRCLDAFGLKFNGSIICNALQSDVILEELKLHPVDQSTRTCLVETLECFNTSLKTVETYRYDGRNELEGKILYYTRLNRAGRARVSCDEISLEEFVDLLCKAAIATQCPQLGPTANNTHNMLHGLLRRSPHIWTPLPKPSPTPRKKYKNSQDSMQGWLQLTAEK